MSGQAVLCLSAVRNGCNAKRDPLCQKVLSQILKHMVVDEVLLAAKAKSCNVRSSPCCMCLTAAFMLDSAPAGKSIHSSERGINLLLLSSARLAPLGSLLWNLLQPCCSFALEGKWIGMHCGRAIWSVTKCLGIGVGSYFENVDSSKSI